MMRKWASLPLLCMILLFLQGITVSHAFAQDFTILSFHSDIVINRDSSFTVTETIEVDFHRQRHGIYREIPYEYTDELGRAITTPLTILRVTDHAEKKRTYKISASGNLLHVRVGDADKFVSGRQVYIITYSVENALLFFDDHDELYWNVTGNYWPALIKMSSARVILGKGMTSEKQWAACYTGRSGSREKACSYETTTNSVSFQGKRPLEGNEGFTIVFGWDKGLVKPPPAWKKIFRTAKENWPFLLPVISLITMIHLWRTRGRDPRVRESVAVHYDSPRYQGKPLTPGEIGTLIDEEVNSRDITSTIVGLAVKGYLTIEETKRDGLIFDTPDYYLKKVKDPDTYLSAFESELMKSIFSDALLGILVSQMRNSFYVHIPALRKTLFRELVSKGYFAKNPERIRIYYLGAGAVITVCAVAAAVFLTNLFYASSSMPPSVTVKAVLAGMLTGLPVFGFARLMPAKTRQGASALLDILGFQEFMNRAEKDRLVRMDDKDLFSKFLPFAIALDVVDNWAKAFEGLYQNPPEWYVSPSGFRSFNPLVFSRSISAMDSSLGSALYSAPRGSGISSGGGFSGGGSSGGGFGGGGGGSW